MAPYAKRRSLCFVIALLFAISSVAHVYAATDAAMKMPASTTETSTPDHGMDCDGNDKAAHATCVVMCATTLAILGEPVAIPLTIATLDIEAAPQLPLPGRTPSPEPHPPKR